MRILICGISGSGKSTLAARLAEIKQYNRLNADEVRSQFNDWDFSPTGRTRQAMRMAQLANSYDNVIIDMIAPLPLHRAIIKADKLIWMNTKSESRFTDTDLLFEAPKSADLVINNFEYDEIDITRYLGL